MYKFLLDFSPSIPDWSFQFVSPEEYYRLFSQTLRVIMPYRFSIGSGLQDGQSRTLIGCEWNKCFVMLALFIRAISCWNTHYRPAKRSEKCSRLPSNVCTYAWSISRPLREVIDICPLKQNTAQTITESSPWTRLKMLCGSFRKSCQ